MLIVVTAITATIAFCAILGMAFALDTKRRTLANLEAERRKLRADLVATRDELANDLIPTTRCTRCTRK